MHSVFILGAGASVDAGAPLMSTFMDRSEDLLASGKFLHLSKQIARLFELRAKLRLVYANSILDLQNIESLLSALEMGVTIGGIGDYSKQSLSILLRAAEQMIVQTIEESIKFPVETDGARNYVRPTEHYNRFVRLAKSVFSNDVAFITFNYDIGIDMALRLNYPQIEYCLSGIPAGSSGIPLLKLHGSTNWAFGQKTGQIDVFDVSEYLQPPIGVPIAPNETKVKTSDHFRSRYGDRYRPVIVPPTWNKAERHRMIPNVWRAAAKYLSEATHIFVAGYSLPPSDSFFHHMFALSTLQNDKIRRFSVADIDQNVENRFRNLIGPALSSRYTFRRIPFLDLGFAGISK